MNKYSDDIQLLNTVINTPNLKQQLEGVNRIQVYNIVPRPFDIKSLYIQITIFFKKGYYSPELSNMTSKYVLNMCDYLDIGDDNIILTDKVIED